MLKSKRHKNSKHSNRKRNKARAAAFAEVHRRNQLLHRKSACVVCKTPLNGRTASMVRDKSGELVLVCDAHDGRLA